MEEQARLDIAATGAWGGLFELDSNSYALSSRITSSLGASYVTQEREKKIAYE